MEPRQRFDALNETDKAKILDAHRDINVDFDWWDGVYEDFARDMEATGIKVRTMCFSGFWSQGDGACFEGYVNDWGKFLPTVGHTNAALISHAQKDFGFGSSNFNARHCHEHSVEFDYLIPLPASAEDEDFMVLYGSGEELHDAVLLATLPQFDEDVLHNQFAEAFRDHMRDLYKRLETEYEYLTSDEAVLDSLDSNDRLEDAINETTEEEYDHA
jgi:arginyl-tRNA synthetase